MSNQQRQGLHFETPRHAGLLRVKALLALVAATLLGAAAAKAIVAGSLIGMLFGLTGGGVFGMLGMISWRRSRATRPPLVLDEEGLAVDDGLGEAWRLSWERIERVALERVAGRRRIVLVLSGEPTCMISLPAICHGDAPPEWLAGMIETFRKKALHGGL